MVRVWAAANGDVLAEQICEAMGVDLMKVRRIVIDVPFEGMSLVYLELVGDAKLLDINWRESLGGVTEVERVVE